MMTREQSEQIADAMEAAFREVQVDIYSGAQRLKHWLDKRYKHLEASQSRESLTAWLQSCSPDDTEVLESLCFVAAAPAIVLQFVRESVKKSGDAIPNEPGRPTALSIESKRDIVNTIYLLHRKKVRIGDALTRTAAKHGVSRRTAQRVWQERHLIEAQPFQSFDDLAHFVFPSPTHISKSRCGAPNP